MATLQELSVLYATKQPKQVDQLTVASPILAKMPFIATTHPLWNVYEEITAVTGGAFGDFDAVLPTVSAESELKKTDLGVMGGQIEVGVDKAQVFGGASAYFANKMPSILKKSGMTAEYAILYNNLRKFCIDNKLGVSAGASGSAYSIIACRYDDEENTGLHSPNGFGNGAIMEAMPINGGNFYKDSTGKLVYGLALKAYLGWQIASKNAVYTIANIDASHIPTAKQIDDALNAVHADSKTFLYMHPDVASMIAKYKTDYIKYAPTDKAVDNRVAIWNGVPIETSYNFLKGTETAVSFT